MNPEDKTYYEDEGVIYEIVNQLKQRELVFCDVDKNAWMRYMTGYNIALWESSCKGFRLMDKTTKVYASVGKVFRTPWVSYKSGNERKEGIAEWLAIWDNGLIGYDFILDLDNDDMEKSYADAVTIKEIFDNNKIGYSTNFSGNRGFHFRVPDKFVSFIPLADRPEKLLGLAKTLNKFTKYKSVDLSVYKKKQLLKIPYTIDGSTGLVVMPLSDKQFNEFDQTSLLPETILEDNKLGFRGLQTREGSWDGVLNLMKNG